jgi:N-acetylmuramic acid 6-phosphate (MurNAc-6-P) etherase
MELLKQANGHVKAAIVMHARTVDLAKAVSVLSSCNGRLRDALQTK